MKIERRIAAGKAEVRTEGAVTQIVGHGAVFNVEAVIGNNFRERIMPGAFAGVIGATADVRSLFNHDKNFLLGRTTAGTLTLSEDETGLRYEVSPPASRSDVLESVTRGDITGSSFGFIVKRDEWTRAARSGELPLRTIHEYGELVDVGPVTYPAYNEATAEVRDKAASLASVVPAVPDETRASSPAALVEYQTVASGFATAVATLATASELVAGLIAAEPAEPPAYPLSDVARAAKDLDTARLRSLLVLCEQIAGTVCGVSRLVQAKLSDDYDPILYMRSAAVDGDRGRRLQLARATR